MLSSFLIYKLTTTIKSCLLRLYKKPAKFQAFALASTVQVLFQTNSFLITDRIGGGGGMNHFEQHLLFIGEGGRRGAVCLVCRCRMTRSARREKDEQRATFSLSLFSSTPATAAAADRRSPAAAVERSPYVTRPPYPPRRSAQMEIHQLRHSPVARASLCARSLSQLLICSLLVAGSLSLQDSVGCSGELSNTVW